MLCFEHALVPQTQNIPVDLSLFSLSKVCGHLPITWLLCRLIFKPTFMSSLTLYTKYQECACIWLFSMLWWRWWWRFLGRDGNKSLLWPTVCNWCLMCYWRPSILPCRWGSGVQVLSLADTLAESTLLTGYNSDLWWRCLSFHITPPPFLFHSISINKHSNMWDILIGVSESLEIMVYHLPMEELVLAPLGYGCLVFCTKLGPI